LTPVKDENDVESSKLINGDIIVFQIGEDEENKTMEHNKSVESQESQNTQGLEENKENKEEKKVLNAPDYYGWLAYSVDVTFRKLDAPTEDVCTIKLDSRITYQQTSIELGEKNTKKKKNGFNFIFN
jgi:hypothetical protein